MNIEEKILIEANVLLLANCCLICSTIRCIFIDIGRRANAKVLLWIRTSKKNQPHQIIIAFYFKRHKNLMAS